MNNFQYPKQLTDSWNELKSFVTSLYGQNIDSKDNMEQFKNILNKSLPLWDKPDQVNTFNKWRDLSRNRPIDHGRIDRNRLIIDLIQNTEHSCITLWCALSVIVIYFNVKGIIYIEWDADNKSYNVVQNNPQIFRNRFPNRRWGGRSNPRYFNPRQRGQFRRRFSQGRGRGGSRFNQKFYGNAEHYRILQHPQEHVDVSIDSVFMNVIPNPDNDKEQKPTEQVDKSDEQVDKSKDINQTDKIQINAVKQDIEKLDISDT